jgi:CheY-like chemotaxis protein/GAF domain-containing protein
VPFKYVEVTVPELAPVDVLNTSADLQSSLIRNISGSSVLDSILRDIVTQAAGVLRADACAIFTVDQPERRRATQRAGTGYQEPFQGAQDVRVVPDSQVRESPEPGDELGLTGWILSSGKPFLAHSPEELRGHPHHSGRFDHLQSPEGDLLVGSFLGVPIRGLRGDVIGMIKAERRLFTQNKPSEAFSVHDELALESIARVASRCIAYHAMAREGPEAEAEAVTSWARDVIAEAVATEGEVDSFLDIVVKVTAAAMRSDACGIFLKDESGKTLTQRAGLGHLALRHVIRSYRLPDPSRLQQCRDVTHCKPPNCTFWHDRTRTPEDEARVGLTAWIQITGKSFHASSYEELARHCHHLGEFDKHNFSAAGSKTCGAFVGVPLKVANTVIGVIKVENTSSRIGADPRDFSRDAQRRFEILAQDIALAIIRLESQLDTRYGIIKRAEKTILEILRGGRDIKDLVNQVVRETRELFQAGACALFLKQGDHLVQPRWAAAGWFQKGPEVREYALVAPEAIQENPTEAQKVGLTAWIAVTQQKFTARSNMELRMHPHHRGTFDRDNFETGKLERCESFMGFPLLVEVRGEKQLVGVLKVESKMRVVDGDEEYTYFNERDELVFELIANSAALAIQNTYLADDTARELAWQEFSGMAAHAIGTEAQLIGNALRTLENELKGSASRVAEQALARSRELLGRVFAYVWEFTQFASPPVAKSTRVDVNELCREVQDASQGDGIIRPMLELDSDLPFLWGDRERLQYALKEMYQNALKAVKDKGSDARITITTRCVDEGKIVIEYIDNGPGIEADKKVTIFQPGVKYRHPGTGLGLAIVRKTVEQHKGSIRENGTFGEGARFVIELPIGTSKRPPERILIVEDRPQLRLDLADLLRSGVPNRLVDTAANEVEAIHVTGQTRYDLVITDIDLSEAGGTFTGGLKLLEALRASDPKLPVIVITAHPKYEDEAKRLGCHRFIRLPCLGRDFMDVMKEAVADALGRDRGLSGYNP